jgi:hypothetical protein
MLQGRNWSKVCTACSTDNQLQTAQPISIFLYQEHFFGGLFAPSNTFSLYCDFFTIFTRCDKVTRCYKVVTGLKFVYCMLDMLDMLDNQQQTAQPVSIFTRCDKVVPGLGTTNLLLLLLLLLPVSEF